MIKKYFLITLFITFNFFAMDKEDSHTNVSINSDKDTQSVLVYVNNTEAISLIRDWLKSEKPFDDWKKNKINESTSLLTLEGLQGFAHQIESLKKAAGVYVEPMFKHGLDQKDFDREYLTHNESRFKIKENSEMPLILESEPLVIKLDGISSDTVKKLKSLGIVSDVITGTPRDISKEVMSFKLYVLRAREFYKTCCCVSGTAVGSLLLGLGVGSLITYFAMNFYHDNYDDLVDQNNCYQLMYSNCKNTLKGLCDYVCPNGYVMCLGNECGYNKL